MSMPQERGENGQVLVDDDADGSRWQDLTMAEVERKADRAAAREGLRHLARHAESEKVRFRACEYLAFGLVPPTALAYQEGMIDPKTIRQGAIFPVHGEPAARLEVVKLGADID